MNKKEFHHRRTKKKKKTPSKQIIPRASYFVYE